MVVIALSILPCVVMLFYRRPLLLLYLWPVFISISALFVEANVEVEGFAQLPFMFLPMDVVYGFTIMHLGLYAVLRPRRFVALLKENPFLTIFLAIVALYVVIYTPIYGKTAVGEARKYYFMFLVPWLSVISIRTSQDLRRLMLIVVLCAACVAAACVFQALTFGSLVRTQSGAQTLFIAFSMFAILIHRIYRMVIITRRMDTALLCLFGVLIIWSGQRSVWMGTGMGVALIFALYRSRSTIVARAGVTVIGALLSLVLAMAMFPESGERIVRAFEGILNPSGDETASWRMEGWRNQLDDLRKENGIFFGKGLGSYYGSYDTRTIGADPHNAYVQTVLKFGLFGLIMYGFLAFQFFRLTLTNRNKLELGPMRAYVDIGVLNFGAAHAFMLGYGFTPIILIFFAVAASATKLSHLPVRESNIQLEHLRNLRMYCLHARLSPEEQVRRATIV